MPYADPEKARNYAATYARKARAKLKAENPDKYAEQLRKHSVYQKTDAAKEARRKRYGTRERTTEQQAAEKRRLKARRYGLTPEAFESWYQQTLEAQGNACPICSQAFEHTSGRRTGAPVVDHDHDTLRLRALLCSGCNVTVGFIEKNTTRAIAAADYVLRHLDTGQSED